MELKKQYECVFIVRNDATVSQVENLAQNYASVIKNQGGEVSKIEFCGLRPLAYPIKKNKRGHYVLMNILSPASAINEIERQMRLSEDVLRYLTIKVEELDSNPSPLIQQRHFRDEQRPSYEEKETVDVVEQLAAAAE